MPGLVQEWTWNQKQGDAARFVATWKSDADVPYNITGFTPELFIGKKRGGPALDVWTEAPQVAITDAAQGKITVFLTPEETSAWGHLTDLEFELKLIPPNEETITIMEGKLRMRLMFGPPADE